jgi:hypothetical protein
MRINSLKTLGLILSLSKDKASMLPMVRQAHHEDELIEKTRPHPEPVEG